MNEPRGCFFEALTQEYGFLLAKFHVQPELNDPEIVMLPGMEALLRTLMEIASTFTEAVTQPWDQFPRLIEPILCSESRSKKEGLVEVAD